MTIWVSLAAPTLSLHLAAQGGCRSELDYDLALKERPTTWDLCDRLSFEGRRNRQVSRTRQESRWRDGVPSECTLLPRCGSLRGTA